MIRDVELDPTTMSSSYRTAREGSNAADFRGKRALFRRARF
jgi:hypothetical protein